MKYLIILGDGMADEPIAMLGGKTPLQAANTPNMDRLAAMGRSGMLYTVPKGFAPGSEIANLTVLGYNVAEVFEGRGSLEAASMGIDIAPGEMAMRCNLINITDGKIKNHSAGHISNEEAAELIEYLQQELGEEDVDFFAGVSYRHLLKIKGADKRIDTTPPHDVVGTPFEQVLAVAQCQQAESSANRVNDLILRSQELLSKHKVNVNRALQGKDTANSIWPWSPGYLPKMQRLAERYGIGPGAVISAVDLIKGIGVYAGLQPIEVVGATGLYDTNYEGKMVATIEALRTSDFVYLHIEASDEAGHEGDVALKVKTIEYLDGRVVGPLMEELSRWDQKVIVAMLPDHPTPCSTKTHTSNPVPFVIYDRDVEPDSVTEYSEQAALDGAFGALQGVEFMDLLIKK